MTVPSDPDAESPRVHLIQLGIRRAGSEKAGLEPRLERALVVEETPVVSPTILDPRETYNLGTTLL